MKVWEIDNLIQRAVDEFANGDMKNGAEAVGELAGLFKSAGMSREQFLQLCQDIESTAADKSGDPLIRDHIKLALRDKLQRDRGSAVIH